MSGSFCRLHSAPAGRCPGARPPAIIAIIAYAYFMTLSYPARAGEHLLSRIEQPDQAIVIREHAGWNKNCEAIAHPALYLFSPPRHGKICARMERIKITSMFVGTESQCIGRRVRGVQLIYRPDNAYIGDDVIQYAVQYPSVLRAISVKVTVKGNPPGKSTVEQSGFLLPSAQSQQLPRLIPACPQLIF